MCFVINYSINFKVVKGGIESCGGTKYGNSKNEQLGISDQARCGRRKRRPFIKKTKNFLNQLSTDETVENISQTIHQKPIFL